MKKIKEISIVASIAISFFLLSLSALSFQEVISNEKHFALDTSWHDFQINNTKTYIKRNLVKTTKKVKSFFTSKKSIIKSLENSGFNYLELLVKPYDLNIMNSDLPKSGKDYFNAEILVNNQKTPVEVKYRGDNFYHWGYDKKSITIKKQDGSKINLINPKPANLLATKIAFDLANQLKLYAPKTKYTGLFINNEYQGIFEESEEIDSQYITQNNFDFWAIFQGENIGESRKSGPELFIDPYKWNISGGYASKSTLTPFLESINNKSAEQITSFFDYQYLLDFYTYVALIQNAHFDSVHNWFLGLKENGKFYPIVWDPVGWVMNYDSGDGVEEMKFILTEKLRKNIYFNRDFTQKLWGTINDNSLKKSLFTAIEKDKLLLENNLKYDLYLGGVFGNPNGNRAYQSTADVLSKIEELKETINSRYTFLKNKLSEGNIEYYIQDNFLYLTYTGTANATIESIYKNSQDIPKIEVYNDFVYHPNPYNSSEIFSDREKAEGGYPYAKNCPTTFRIPINLALPLDIKIKNILTGKDIPIKKTNSLVLKDCFMDFSRPQDSNSNNELNLAQSNNKLDTFSINLPIINPYHYLENKDRKDEGSVTFAGVKIKNVKFKKEDPFQNIFKLSFTDKNLLNRNKFLLIPDSLFNKYLGSIDISQKYNLPTPSVSLDINLYINDFYIDHYHLVESQEDKAFYETQKLTFDTDIYKTNNYDTSSFDSWEKISSDPHLNSNDHETLKKLFDSLENENFSKEMFDDNNLNSYLSYLAESGEEYPHYLIYFDNTQGKYLFFPAMYTKYKTNPNYQLKDPLLVKITDQLAQETPWQEVFENDIFIKDTSNQELVLLEGEYHISENLIIPAGYTVNIKPGVKISLAKNTSLISYSPVKALGTKDKPITIQSADKAPFAVFAIIGKEASGSVLDFVKVSGGSETFVNNLYLSGQFSAYHADIVIKNSTFNDSQSDDGINLKYSTSEISNCYFENNSADAIDLDFVDGIVKNNTFKGNGNDSIDISGSSVQIEANDIQNSGDKCISIGENSYPKVVNNILDSCNIGIEVKDSSKATILDNVIKNNNIGINAYQKKEFFTGGYADVFKTIFTNNKKDIDYQNTFTGEKMETDDSKIMVN